MGVIHALVNLEGRPVFIAYREVDLPQRELSNDICNDIVHLILQNGLVDCSGDSHFFSLEVFNRNQPLSSQAFDGGL